MVRKSRKQKTAFLSWLTPVLEQAGYSVTVQKGGIRCRNLIVGDPERAKLVLTAHYDTCAVMPIPNFITPGSILFYLLYQIGLTLLLFAAAAAVAALVSLLAGTAAIAGLVFLLCVITETVLMMAGPANKHTYNDNSSGVVTLLETALSLPPQLRDKVCFVFFDNEELGLLGSSLFHRRYRKIMRDKPLLNFDCVSDGDHILILPSKAVRKQEELMQLLQRSFVSQDSKTVTVCKKSLLYPSDQTNFNFGIGAAAFKKAPVLGLYMDRIHTPRDTVFDEENIQLLCHSAQRLAELL